VCAVLKNIKIIKPAFYISAQLLHISGRVK